MCIRDSNTTTLVYISSSIARLYRESVVVWERDHAHLFLYSSSASGSFKSLNNFPLFLLSHMLSNPLLTIFSPTKAPAMITPTYTDVFDCWFVKRERKRKELIHGWWCWKRGKSGKKNTIIIIIIKSVVVYRVKHFRQTKKKNKAKKGTLSAPRSNKTGVPRKTHHERLVKRVEHL